jgi:hypothetical protein
VSSATNDDQIELDRASMPDGSSVAYSHRQAMADQLAVLRA